MGEHTYVSLYFFISTYLSLKRKPSYYFKNLFKMMLSSMIIFIFCMANVPGSAAFNVCATEITYHLHQRQAIFEKTYSFPWPLDKFWKDILRSWNYIVILTFFMFYQLPALKRQEKLNLGDPSLKSSVNMKKMITTVFVDTQLWKAKRKRFQNFR